LIGGGSSPSKFCDPRLAILREKYPNVDIKMITYEPYKTEYNPFKNDFYKYTCSFVAIPKK
jgi:hypothetical protein